MEYLLLQLVIVPENQGVVTGSVATQSARVSADSRLFPSSEGLLFGERPSVRVTRTLCGEETLDSDDGKVKLAVVNQAMPWEFPRARRTRATLSTETL